LIVLDSSDIGGSERQAIYLYNGLKKFGYNVKVLILSAKKGILYSHFNSNDLFSLSINKKIFHEEIKLSNILSLIKQSIKFILYVNKLRCDFIIPFTYFPNIISNLLFKYCKAKKCVWNQRDEGRHFRSNWFEKIAIKNSNYIISNSTEGELFLNKITNKKVVKIFNGVLVPTEYKNYFLSDSNNFNLIMVANLHEFKDHLTLIKAMPIVLEKFSTLNIKLYLVGRKSKFSENILRLITQLKIENNVVINGFVENVNHEILNCELSVFCSNKEGLPNGILECMALGMPVIASKINGAIDALGINYLYFSKPSDPIDLAEKISMFIENRDLLPKIGSINRNRIINNFSVDIMISKYQQIINGI